MEGIYDLIRSNLTIVMVFLAILLLLWFVSSRKEELKFLLLDLRYSLPLIGKVARLSKDYQSTKTKNGILWWNSEDSLCADYATYYEKVDKNADFYDQCQSYLSKVDERGRSELHLFGWLLIFALVLVEAMGFSYVLAGFTIPGASEDTQRIGALGIAFLVSVLLVAFTHQTGHEWHANSLIGKAKKWWQQDQQHVDKPVPCRGDNRVGLHNDSEDDEHPQWKQLLTRIENVNTDVTPSYKITVFTFILITIVAIGATYVRGQVLNEMLIDEQSMAMKGSEPFDRDPFSETSQLPGELVNIQKEADNKATIDIIDAQRKGGWATFIVLAVIFVFLQIFGILIGYKTGFAGKESAVAKTFLWNFNTRDQFEAFYNRKKQQIARVSQKRLSALQQKLAQRANMLATDQKLNALAATSGERRFLDYATDAVASESDHDYTVIKDDHDHRKNVEMLKVNKLEETQKKESLEEMKARIRQEEIEKIKSEANMNDSVDREALEAELRENIRREELEKLSNTNNSPTS